MALLADLPRFTETAYDVRLEMANRGLGERGQWVGFPHAREIWRV